MAFAENKRGAATVAGRSGSGNQKLARAYCPILVKWARGEASRDVILDIN